MANGSNRTIAVALAGIAATALVGLAGTTASWLNARDERATRRTLARDQQTYDERAAVYLDAIDFLQGQKDTWEEYSQATSDWALDRNRVYRRLIPHDDFPPRRLTTRLRVFGSTQAFEAFQKTQALEAAIPSGGGEGFIYATRLEKLGLPRKPPRAFYEAHRPFIDQVNRFEDIVHDELGF
jgi:hypothetical protein